MYKCQQCSNVVPSKSHELRLVVETRPKTYPPRKDANLRMRKVNKCVVCQESDSKHNHLDHRFVSPADDPGGEGVEIVRELRVCPDCYAGIQQQVA